MPNAQCSSMRNAQIPMLNFNVMARAVSGREPNLKSLATLQDRHVAADSSAIVITAIVATLSICTMQASSTEFVITVPLGDKQPSPTPVEIWSGSDDGLTQRLIGALTQALHSSADFMEVEPNSKIPGSLKILIPPHVGWRRVNGRTRVSYRVEFSTVSDVRLGTGSGQCWEEDLSSCTAQIPKGARDAVKELRKRQRR